ncbi:hypothetical protein BDC45DRAFT_533104 [Circinella umbellata]|nr:hypothetical protein BDC45DRAFT_533104 [Circinella umbellata]
MVAVDIGNDMTILALGILIVSATVIVSLMVYCYCCNASHRRSSTLDVEEQQQPDDRSPLLSTSFRARYMKRTSTFYQWNRPAPPSPSSSSLSEQHQEQQGLSSQQQQDRDTQKDNNKRSSWISRRTELLKKYARSPSFNTATTTTTS